MSLITFRYFLYGVIFSLSLSSLVAQAGTTDGVFGDYFTRMIGLCPTNSVVTGFSTNTTDYGTRQCKTITELIGSVFVSSSAPEGQAVVGFNPDGSLKYGDGTWKQSGGNISYTGGKVGIGTNAPQQKLDVRGGISFGSAAQGGIGYYNNSGYNQIEFGTPRGSTTDVSFHTDGVSKMWIKPNGNVGIGILNPSEKLDVSGNTRITGNLSVSTVTIPGLVMSSDSWGIKPNFTSGWSMVTRNNSQHNSQPGVAEGSIYVNDIYIRSIGKWASQLDVQVQATANFGGAFQVGGWNSDGGCRHPNILTNACSCPPGYSPVWMGGWNYGSREEYAFVCQK